MTLMPLMSKVRDKHCAFALSPNFRNRSRLRPTLLGWGCFDVTVQATILSWRMYKTQRPSGTPLRARLPSPTLCLPRPASPRPSPRCRFSPPLRWTRLPRRPFPWRRLHDLFHFFHALLPMNLEISVFSFLLTLLLIFFGDQCVSCLSCLVHFCSYTLKVRKYRKTWTLVPISHLIFP